MGHIHGESGQHDLTVSAYIILFDNEVPKILLHRHRKTGRLMQFGGHVELNENPWQALERELLEEAGYTFSQLQLLQPKYDLLTATGSIAPHPQPMSLVTYPAGGKHYHTDICYAFVTAEGPKLHRAPDEVLDIQALSQDVFESLSEDEVFINVRDAISYLFKIALPQWRRTPLRATKL